MTKQELIELIRETIQEVGVEEGIALYYNREKDDKFYPQMDKTDEFVVDFDFTQTRLDDLIVLNSKPRRITIKDGVRINAYIPFKFKSINDIANDYLRSKSKISLYYYDVEDDGKKPISGLKNSLRTAIKNLKTTNNVILSSQNVDDIKQMVKNGISKFNEESETKITDYDLIVKVPSSAPLNDLILSEFKNYISNDKPKIITDLILKDFIKKVSFDYKKWRRDNFKPSMNVFKRKSNLSRLKHSKYALGLKNPDDDFQIKSVDPASYRIYFKDFLRFNPQIDRTIFNAIYGGKILIIDDTFGRGVTIVESVKLLTRAKPSLISTFMLIDDWVASEKTY